jgi:hypothetical protein
MMASMGSPGIFSVLRSAFPSSLMAWSASRCFFTLSIHLAESTHECMDDDLWAWRGLRAQLSLLYCIVQAMKASEQDIERLQGSALATGYLAVQISHCTRPFMIRRALHAATDAGNPTTRKITGR